MHDNFFYKSSNEKLINKYLKLKKFFWATSRLLETPIAKKNKFRVIFNILIFQIKKNFSKKPFVFKTCTNTFAYTQKYLDTSGIAGLFHTGLIEASEILCAWHLVRPNDIFLILEQIKEHGV